MDRVCVWKWKQLGDLLLICASEGQLQDADLEPCLHLHRTNQVTRGICWGLGNINMSPLQRKKTSESMGEHRSANITDSSIGRGIITAMAWMGKPWSAYASKDMARAITEIGLPAGFTVNDVIDELHKLRRDVEREAGVVFAVR
jgi:hypothetical protein